MDEEEKERVATLIAEKAVYLMEQKQLAEYERRAISYGRPHGDEHLGFDWRADLRTDLTNLRIFIASKFN